MNGGGGGEMDGGGKAEEEAREEKRREKVVLMWGYLPGVSPQRSPILSPTAVPMPESAAGESWREVCGGGCGFAMAVSAGDRMKCDRGVANNLDLESGKLFTWGSTDDMGQSYVAAGKHEEIPEPFPLPNDVAIVKAAAGWAHCVAATASGDVYTWGWKECVPSGKALGDTSDQQTGGVPEKDDKHGGSSHDQASPRSVSGSRSHVSGTSSGTISSHENTKAREEGTKRRKLSSAKQGPESSTSGDETLSAPPCLVTLNPEVKIAAVAAGGRHTLVLSDVGQVWGWGYGGEGQLGLGSRIRMVASPTLVPCIESAAYRKDRTSAPAKASTSSDSCKVVGSRVRAIACGGRHSAVVTDAGAIITFGWGLYGQCGQGCTDDELSPKCVSSLLGVKINGVAAGLWHTLCISAEGDVYTFGGNQFGQLGTGCDQAETIPKLLEAQCLENKKANAVSCGARHSAIVTEDGEAYCWGWNKYGQLGLGDSMDRSTPTKVPSETHRLTSVSCGWWHTLALAETPT